MYCEQWIITDKKKCQGEFIWNQAHNLRGWMETFQQK